jgi:predicted 3-demethylubiquinone-9 3-methyltransferase (glyoxalase superfamily)
MQKIVPCLWFNNNVKEALDFYKSVFPNVKIKDINHYPAGGPLPEGEILTATFELEGQEFMALNGGPDFKFTEAISLMVKCRTQDEIDFYWEKLSEGGEKSQCGWLKDKFGLSWQVVPDHMEKLLNDKEPLRAARVFQAIMKMKKIDLAKLEREFEGGMD